MHCFTHNNHFKFGWNDRLYNFQDKSQKYWVSFGKAEYVPRSFKEECLRAAELIYKNARLPILVFFSGGIDSEVIVRSLQEANVPFEVAIMKLNYKNLINVNDHDNRYAFEYAKTHNLTTHVVEFDLEDFIKNRFETEATMYRCNFLGITIHTEISKMFLNHNCILGGGDIKLKRHRTHKRPHLDGLFIEEHQISVHAIEAAMNQNSTINNRFFMYTPELMLSWLLDPDVKHFIKYEFGLQSKYSSMDFIGLKSFVYYKHWPNMVPRPKFTGFEKLPLWDPTRVFEQDFEIINVLNKVRDKYDIANVNDFVIIDHNDLLNNLHP